MSGLRRGSFPSLLALLVVMLVTLAVVYPAPKYWQYVATIGMIQALIGLSIGVVYGTAGMLSLCQVSLAAIGSWTVGYMTAQDHLLGLPWSLAVGAVLAVPVGLLVGLPALRLRGVNLAIVTLGFAVAIYTVGKVGEVPGSTSDYYIVLPRWLNEKGAWFLAVWVSFLGFAAVVILLRRSRWGLSWLAIARSERAAAALGVSVFRAKLTAFGVSAAIAGWAGGMLVATFGSADPGTFSPFQCLSFFVLAVMMGAGFWEGAFALGFFNAVSSALLRQWNISPDVATLLFAIGSIQVLSAGRGGFSGDVRRLIARGRKPEEHVVELRSRSVEGASLTPSRRAQSPEDASGLQIVDLTVRYGAVTALDHVSFSVPSRSIVGLVGPNGAGKSTLVDACTGFIAAYGGSVLVDGAPQEGIPPHRRARVLRRTFQSDRTVGELSPPDYLRISAARDVTRAELGEILDFVGCTATRTRLDRLDVRTRRLLMIGSCLVGRPRVALIDEPAAGLSADESEDLGLRLIDIPDRFGASVLVIEHDMELVRLVCPEVAVLDFGKLIAFDHTADALDDPRVQAAYLGDELASRA